MITENKPTKVNTATIYEKIKEHKDLLVVENVLYIYDEKKAIWHQVDETAGILRLRETFVDSTWQSVLTEPVMKKIYRTLLTDPDLQSDKKVFEHEKWMKFKNCIWDFSEEKIIHDREVKFWHCINAEMQLKEPVESKVFCKFCDTSFVNQIELKKQALYEIIGFCISDLVNVKKSIFLIGPGNSGKSVISNFIIRLLGEEFVSNVAIQNFGQRFAIAGMYGKVLNVSGEVPVGCISGKALDIFKGITGGDRMEVEHKGINAFFSNIKTKLLFAGNSMPVFSQMDGSNALANRIHILIFDNEIQEKDQDPFLAQKLWEDRNSIVFYSLKALNAFLKRGRMFMSLEDEDRFLAAFRETYNPVRHFINEKIVKDEEAYLPISEAFDAYCKVVEEEGMPPLRRLEFRNLMISQPEIRLCSTKKRVHGGNPRACFKGIKLKHSGQDTAL